MIQSIRVCSESPENFEMYSHFNDLEVLFFQSLKLKDPKSLRKLELPFNLKRLIISVCSYSYGSLSPCIVSKESRAKLELKVQKFKEQCIQNIRLPFNCKVKFYDYDCEDAYEYFTKHSKGYPIESLLSCPPACKDALEKYK